jgi:primosomal replication protein N
VVQLSVLRYTPSGVAMLTLEIDHACQVFQAGSHRAISFSLEITALGDAAIAASQLMLGSIYTFEGFWAPAHYRTKRIGFHLLHIV